jgi:hypothetical protein
LSWFKRVEAFTHRDALREGELFIESSSRP